MLRHYPWDKLEKGQGFFVPALDLEAVRQAGLLAAVPLHLKDARAAFVIRRGKLGVFFYRLPPVLSQQA
jgi:hypothetical protein